MTEFDGIEPLAREATASIIADRVRGLIRDGTLRAGEQIGEARLAESLGVSRGPVREALQRLIQEDLLESRPHRGVFVRSLDDAEIADIYFVRSAIEQAAARRLATEAEDADLAGLTSLLDRMEEAAQSERWGRLAELDLEFHLALVQASRSRRLLRMFRTLMVETSMCLQALGDAYPVQEDLVIEHRKLHRAITDGDPDHAADVVSEHLGSAVAELTVEDA